MQRPYIKSNYFAFFSIVTLIFSFILNEVFALSQNIPKTVFFTMALVIGIGALMPEFAEYRTVYSSYAPRIQTKGYLLLACLSIIFNALASGFVAYTINENVASGIVGAFPWMLAHGIVGSAIAIMVYLTIHKITDSPPVRKNMVWVAIISALLSALIFTPAGSVGWMIRQAQPNIVISFILKNTVAIPATAMLSAAITHSVLISIERNESKEAVLRGLEFLLATISLTCISTSFITLVGNCYATEKSPLLIFSFLTFYMLFLAVFRITFYLISALPIRLLAASR